MKLKKRVKQRYRRYKKMKEDGKTTITPMKTMEEVEKEKRTCIGANEENGEKRG